MPMQICVSSSKIVPQQARKLSDGMIWSRTVPKMPMQICVSSSKIVPQQARNLSDGIELDPKYCKALRQRGRAYIQCLDENRMCLEDILTASCVEGLTYDPKELDFILNQRDSLPVPCAIFT